MLDLLVHLPLCSQPSHRPRNLCCLEQISQVLKQSDGTNTMQLTRVLRVCGTMLQSADIIHTVLGYVHWRAVYWVDKDNTCTYKGMYKCTLCMYYRLKVLNSKYPGIQTGTGRYLPGCPYTSFSLSSISLSWISLARSSNVSANDSPQCFLYWL